MAGGVSVLSVSDKIPKFQNHIVTFFSPRKSKLAMYIKGESIKKGRSGSAIKIIKCQK